MSKDNITNLPNPDIDPDEYSAMETDAEKAKSGGLNLSQFTSKLKKPFEYMGKSYEELTFDFDSLSGQDCLDIGNELAARGVTVVAPEFSTEYQRTFAAKACIQRLPSDAYPMLPAKEFLKIVRAARTFLLVAE